MSSTRRTVIESLPVDLWFELFENYFTVKELWFSFRNLNMRINNILNQTNLYLAMSSFPQNNSEYKSNQILPIEINLQKTKSLIINSIHYMEEFFALHNFTAFSQLRSIYLNNIFVDKIIYVKLLDQLASLKYLRSLSIAIRTFHNDDVYFYSLEEEKMVMAQLTDCFLRFIFFEQRIPSLKCLQLHEDVIRLPSSLTSLREIVPLAMKIEHLTIDKLYFDVLFQLISYLPMVKSIHIGYLKDSNDYFKSYTILESTEKIHAKPLINCVYFSASIGLNSKADEFDPMKLLLRMLPAVHKLSLKGLPISLLNITHWTFLLSNLCPKLSKLLLNFENRLPFKSIAEGAQKTISSIPFWDNYQLTSRYDEHRSNAELCMQFNTKLAYV